MELARVELLESDGSEHRPALVEGAAMSLEEAVAHAMERTEGSVGGCTRAVGEAVGNNGHSADRIARAALSMSAGSTNRTISGGCSSSARALSCSSVGTSSRSGML